MPFSLAEIAAALDAELLGNGNLIINAVAEPAFAGPGDIVLVMSAAYADDLAKGQARAAILWPGADWRALGLEGAIIMASAGAAMVGLTGLMDKGPDIAAGIHPTAVIDQSASIGAGAAIGPFVVIGRDVRIGKNARIASHVCVERAARIGTNALIHAGVRIGADVRIGDNFIAQYNACIGSDGFSFKTTTEKSAVETLRGAGGEKDSVKGSHHWARVHSLGAVVIGDDVEIGAGSCIDRGTIRPTSIGRGTKLDNLVHIGHNCEIGEDCLICGAVGIAGSVRIGNRVVLAGQVGVTDNIFIGDDVIAGGRTSIFSNVPSGRAIWGTPAVRLEAQMAINKETRRLPRLADRLRALEKTVSQIEKRRPE